MHILLFIHLNLNLSLRSNKKENKLIAIILYVNTKSKDRDIKYDKELHAYKVMITNYRYILSVILSLPSNQHGKRTWAFENKLNN